MYNISNTATKSAVEAALAAQTRVFKHRISFGSLSAAGVFTAQKTIDEGIISLHISQQMNGNGSGLVMGCCCAACADAEFYNPDKTFVYEGKTLFVECGIQLEDGSFYYIPLGYYKTEKPESDDDYYTVKIKCYDAVNAMTGKWQSALSFPSATAYDILFEAASKYGVGIVISSSIMRTKLRNRYVTAEEAAILGQYTDREVIGILAGLVGCNARINTVGKLAIGWYSGSVSIPAELQWQNGFKKTQEAAFTISSVTSGSDDNVFTAGTGSGISFVNPIITEDEITAIYGEISDYEFQPCECEWRGNPCVEVGDMAVVTDRKGKTYSVYIAAQELDLTGGLSSTVSCPAGDAEVSFDTVDERTRSALNKQRTTLQEAIIAASNAINGALGGYLKIGDSDGDGNPDYMLITENANGEAVSGSATNGYIMFNKAGIGLSVDGGKTYRTAITFSGINADCITTGKLSADLIDTSRLIVSKGNVTGLDAELDAITNSVDTANTNASNAQTTASSAKTAANNANTTASAAQTTANSVNTVIGQWCYNNDTTFINGGQIYTGSITTSKLSVGSAVVENLFYNSEFNEKPLTATTSVANWVYGWSPYASSLSFDTSTNIVTSSFYGNLIPHDRSEFVSTEGWSAENGTFTEPWVGLDFIKFDPKNGSSRSSIAHTVYLVNGKCYSLSCQVNFLGWGYVEGPDANDKKGTRIGYIIDGKMTYWNLFDSDGAPPENSGNKEYNLEFCFKFDGETGWHDVGLGWRDIWVDSTKTTPCSVHIAWIGISEVTTQRTKGIWSSNSKWTSKTTSYYDSVDSYVSNVLSPYLMKDLQIFFQKRRADVGKRYAILARIKIKNPETKSGLVGVWDGMEGKSYTQGSMSISSSSNMESFVTVKFVFDHDTSVADNIADYGIYWRDFYNSAGAPCDVLIRWMKMYEAPNEELGFYCSESTWLSSSFQSTRLLPDSDVSSTYMQAPSLFVKNNNLYFNGYVNGASGKMGCLGYSFNDVSITNSSYFYLNIAEPSSTRQFDISSRLSFNIPEKILTLGDANGNGANITEAYSPLYEAQTGISQTIEWNDGARTLKTVTSAGGVYISDATSEISITASGIWRKGTLYKWDNILK